MRKIIVIAHNLRSCHNVGSLLRTAEGLGVGCVYLTGYTPYPHSETDERLPHIAQKVHTQIQKTALGAETTQPWAHRAAIQPLLTQLKKDDYIICALEQADQSQPLQDYQPGEKVALILGREVEGIEAEILARADKVLEIPMFGHKESFNVVQATAMALYQLRFA